MLRFNIEIAFIGARGDDRNMQVQRRGKLTRASPASRTHFPPAKDTTRVADVRLLQCARLLYSPLDGQLHARSLRPPPPLAVKTRVSATLPETPALS